MLNPPLLRTLSIVLRTGSFAAAGRHLGYTEDGEPRQLLTRLLEGDLDIIVVFSYDLVPQTWPAGCVRTPLLTEPVQVLVPEAQAAPRSQSGADQV